jgi:hypothetical protein
LVFGINNINDEMCARMIHVKMRKNKQTFGDQIIFPPENLHPFCVVPEIRLITPDQTPTLIFSHQTRKKTRSVCVRWHSFRPLYDGKYRQWGATIKPDHNDLRLFTEQTTRVLAAAL